jgi:hypothetical protein
MSEKIKAYHLERGAYVYVRQSTRPTRYAITWRARSASTLWRAEHNSSASVRW